MTAPHRPLTYTRMMIRAQRRYDRLQTAATSLLRAAAHAPQPPAAGARRGPTPRLSAGSR